MNTTPTIIKQFGIWCSGIKYLQHVLMLNWNKQQLRLLPPSVLGHVCDGSSSETIYSWLTKHSGHHLDLLLYFNAIRFVITVRHPYSWAPSYLGYIYRERARSKYDRLQPSDYGRAVADLLNPRYHIWRKLIEQDTNKAMYLQYEDIAANFPEPLVELAVRLDLPLNGSRLRNVVGYKLNLKQGQDEFSQKVRRSIKENTDWETAAYFGYYPDD